MGVNGRGHLGVNFLRGLMCAEGLGCGKSWVRYFGEQGLPAGIQECLERFHRGCVDYLSQQFVLLGWPNYGEPKIHIKFKNVKKS